VILHFAVPLFGDGHQKSRP